METQEQSQSLTPTGAETLAPLRAPARGEREGFSPRTNPLLWRTLGYRTLWGIPISLPVLRSGLLGAIVGGGLVLSGMLPVRGVPCGGIAHVAAVATAGHVLWLSSSIVYRIRRWEARGFLDELLLTELSPREICSAIAQAAARTKTAALGGLMAPFFLYEAMLRFARDTSSGMLFTLACLTLAAFAVLSLFALSWLTMWILWRQKFSPFAAILAAGWVSILPLSAGHPNKLVLFGTAMAIVAVTINAALLLSPKVPSLLLSRNE